MEAEKQILILDKSKWICGQPKWSEQRKNNLGEGYTNFLNEHGYMCCLGQFSKQLEPSVTDEMIRGCTSPYVLNERSGVVIDALMSPLGDGTYENSELANKAIQINDYMGTKIIKKVKALVKLFDEYGFKIKVVN